MEKSTSLFIAKVIVYVLFVGISLHLIDFYNWDTGTYLLIVLPWFILSTSVRLTELTENIK